MAETNKIFGKIFMNMQAETYYFLKRAILHIIYIYIVLYFEKGYICRQNVISYFETGYFTYTYADSNINFTFDLAWAGKGFFRGFLRLSQ